ncbi:MAG: response regulator [Faecalicatena sp.]|uniref:response regulator n=1 Tax=Faecalicatena sp. TaxID=2005360 RepID=UPI00258367D0|nr:response regulator [Faecalicatena sp.]MCI6466437.1 response regulator [Faecalicatena sp.]MDY5618399.1 response regulator [Lachnospiraceae bacterium]
MIKVLVAEDQVLIQQDVCQKIMKTKKDVEVVGTALNGQEAYKKILKFCPDVLITDIRMPLQSGLELIRQLKEEHIPIKTVILSGYKDFDYAKEAIQLGVDEYLLKPVSISDLEYVLNTLEEKILWDQNSRLHQALYQTLNAGASIPSSVLHALSFQECCLILLNLDSCATFSFQDWLSYENELDELLKGPLIQKYLKKGESVHICSGQTYNQRILVFLMQKASQDKLYMMISELQKQLRRFTVSSTFCVSRPFVHLDSLHQEYQLLNTQLKNQLIFGQSAVLRGQNFLEELQKPKKTLSGSLLEDFRFSVKSRNSTEFLRHLHTFLETCRLQKMTQKHLSEYLKQLLHLFYEDTLNSQLTGREMEIDEYLSNAKTYEELELSLQILFEQLFRQKNQDSALSASSEALIEDVKEYIRANYGKEMNINDIAIHFSITPTYLSRLFKKYSDIRPIEYLTNYRIQQACDYFSHSQLTVREVAELCGYANQFYFSKVFKQITSLSPSEYRIQHQAEEQNEDAGRI